MTGNATPTNVGQHLGVAGGGEHKTYNKKHISGMLEGDDGAQSGGRQAESHKSLKSCWANQLGDKI